MDTRVAVTVRGIAAGGAGVADLPDGRVVFVQRTAPGDRATIRIERSRSRWAVGSLCELIEPAPDRRAALCSLYERCGGCQLQHLPYARQLEWKGRVVADALERIGRLEGIGVPDVVASPREIGYRSRVTFTLRRLRGGRVLAGFHALQRPAHVIDVVGECVLPQPELVAAWTSIRSCWGEGARLLPAGRLLRLTLRAGAAGVALVVDGGRRGWVADKLAAAVPALEAIWHLPSGDAGAPRLVTAWTGEAVAPAFTQVNRGAAELLVDHVLGLAGSTPIVKETGWGRPTGPEAGTAHAVDAFCGDGAFGRGLAERGWRVTGIEVDPAAIAIAGTRAGRLGLKRFTLLEGRVEDRLEEALPADLVIVNPPRAGLDQEVVQVIVGRRPARVLYVSCDPATLARDVAVLSSAYVVESIRCFDLFPQAAHVESVLALRALEV